MMSSHFILRSTIAGLLLASAAMSSLACPKTAGPDLAEVDVSSDMTANGLPVQIRQVSSKASTKDVLDSLEKAWKEDKSLLVKRNTVGIWEVLSALSDKCLTTVQLRDQEGAIGFFAIGKPQNTKRAGLYDVGFPLPSGVHVVSDVAARTDERPSRTLLLTSNDSVDTLTERLIGGLQDGGWRDVRTLKVQAPDGSSSDVAQRISARRGEDLVSMVVWTKDRTVAVVSIGQAL